eukprot:c48692_g1_i1.p2 GENE.c48692_g1_i1~~c48692_g1_i1.p2  ORF type:complete len:247 (+),score=44.25 c48692_g1_i1:34-741(+)
MIRTFARIFRETGQALDRLGCTIEGKNAVHDEVSRHRRLVSIGDKAPTVGAGAFIAPSASIVGSVDIGANVTVWYGAVVRSDDGSATFIGEDTTIGVNAILRSMGAEPMHIGSRVVVGPGAVVQTSTLKDECMIGPGAVVGPGTVVETHAMVGGGAVVTAGSVVKRGELWEGNPAVPTRQLSIAERESIAGAAAAAKAIAPAHEREHARTFKSREEEKNKLLYEAGSPRQAAPLF